MYSMKSLLESHSALNRYKVATGLKVSTATSGSSYIMMTKIKRILSREITPEVFDVLKYRYFSRNTEVRIEVFLDRMKSKVDILEPDMMSMILTKYDTDGLNVMIDTIRLSQAKLKKMVAECNPLRGDDEDSDVSDFLENEEDNFISDE